MDRHPNDLTTDTKIDDAIEAAKQYDNEPRAISVEYIGGKADVVVIRLSTGERLTIPREELQDLENATEAQLSEIQLWGGVVAAVGCRPIPAAPVGASVWLGCMDG